MMSEQSGANHPGEPDTEIAPVTVRIASRRAVAGMVIGPYHLLEAVGQGGMGEVWLAEQKQPVRRRVAVKLIKAGMGTHEVVARFEAERQAIAMMDHPAIAKVFDAGSTPEGNPYFVMEYVPGAPITEHCDKHRVSIRERLELFIQVCEGVQHAHQKAIIHRDLKPSNVLVSVHDGKARPKIIDFGVAKATAQPLNEHILYTRLGAMIGTPEYMSPEQAGLTPQDVDTRSDVYSLGAILYELMVGALPFDSQELRREGHDGVRKKILEEEPPKPSTRFRTIGERSSVLSTNRGTESTTLEGQLKGDLDWIAMKALEKDRTRRYGSPSDLAADIRRHLNHEEVLACPPSIGYRAKKFVRRHRFGVAVGAAAVVLLVTFSAVMAVQARRIARERDRANLEAQVSQRVTEFLTGLFRMSDPNPAESNTVTAREILDKGSEKIARELNNQPVVQAKLMDTMGMVYCSLGLFDRATPLVENALSIRRSVLGAENPEVAESLDHSGYVAFEKGDLAGAEKSLRDAVAMQRKLLGSDRLEVTESLSNLAMVLRYKETKDANSESEQHYREALATRRKLLRRDDPAIAQSLNNLAMVLYANERDYAAAEPLFREAIEMNRRLLGEEHPEVSTNLNNLALMLRDQGRYDEAEEMFRKALAIQKKVYGEEHPRIAVTYTNLASLLQRKGDFADAEPLYVKAIELNRRVFPEKDWQIETIKSLLGGCLTADHQYAAAEPLLLESYPIIRSTFGDSHKRTQVAAQRVVDMYNAWGKAQKAAPYAAILVGGKP
ncbi:MAG TPA: tetratricopeptide repeat protein [Bryobacteraceae bacterium]|jgi:serine/threonine protein kinase/tetratricopeptide (TPR) repeat protein|nr:tetratricopeptide repeat protein [Bryobacteraceae bacterium]